MSVRFTQSARRHRIGRAHVYHVMATSIGIPVPTEPGADPKVAWLGQDDRGLVLEVVAALRPDYVLVIHVMPRQLRRRKP